MKFVKKKGLSLIETLGVIVILGIVLAIAIPIYKNVMGENVDNLFRLNATKMLKAGKEYFTRNDLLLPREINETKKVFLNDLIASNLLEEIYNPYNKTEACEKTSSFVSVTLENLNEYKYSALLQCGEKIVIVDEKIETNQKGGMILAVGKWTDWTDVELDVSGTNIEVEEREKYRYRTLTSFIDTNELPILPGEKRELVQEYRYQTWLQSGMAQLCEDTNGDGQITTDDCPVEGEIKNSRVRHLNMNSYRLLIDLYETDPELVKPNILESEFGKDIEVDENGVKEYRNYKKAYQIWKWGPWSDPYNEDSPTGLISISFDFDYSISDDSFRQIYENNNCNILINKISVLSGKTYNSCENYNSFIYDNEKKEFKLKAERTNEHGVSNDYIFYFVGEYGKQYDEIQSVVVDTETLYKYYPVNYYFDYVPIEDIPTGMQPDYSNMKTSYKVVDKYKVYATGQTYLTINGNQYFEEDYKGIPEQYHNQYIIDKSTKMYKVKVKTVKYLINTTGNPNKDFSPNINDGIYLTLDDAWSYYSSYGYSNGTPLYQISNERAYKYKDYYYLGYDWQRYRIICKISFVEAFYYEYSYVRYRSNDANCPQIKSSSTLEKFSNLNAYYTDDEILYGYANDPHQDFLDTYSDIYPSFIRYDYIDLYYGGPTGGKAYSYFKPRNYVGDVMEYTRSGSDSIYHYAFYSPDVSSPDSEKADDEWVQVPNSAVTKLRNEIKNDISMWQRQSDYKISDNWQTTYESNHDEVIIGYKYYAWVTSVQSNLITEEEKANYQNTEHKKYEFIPVYKYVHKDATGYFSDSEKPSDYPNKDSEKSRKEYRYYDKEYECTSGYYKPGTQPTGYTDRSDDSMIKNLYVKYNSDTGAFTQEYAWQDSPPSDYGPYSWVLLGQEERFKYCGYVGIPSPIIWSAWSPDEPDRDKRVIEERTTYAYYKEIEIENIYENEDEIPESVDESDIEEIKKYAYYKYNNNPLWHNSLPTLCLDGSESCTCSVASETCIPLYGNLLEDGTFKLGKFADTAEIFRDLRRYSIYDSDWLKLKGNGDNIEFIKDSNGNIIEYRYKSKSGEIKTQTKSDVEDYGVRIKDGYYYTIKGLSPIYSKFVPEGSEEQKAFEIQVDTNIEKKVTLPGYIEEILSPWSEWKELTDDVNLDNYDRYTTRNVYKYWKWTDWKETENLDDLPTENIQIESKKVYRYRLKGTN